MTTEISSDTKCFGRKPCLFIMILFSSFGLGIENARAQQSEGEVVVSIQFQFMPTVAQKTSDETVLLQACGRNISWEYGQGETWKIGEMKKYNISLSTDLPVSDLCIEGHLLLSSKSTTAISCLVILGTNRGRSLVYHGSVKHGNIARPLQRDIDAELRVINESLPESLDGKRTSKLFFLSRLWPVGSTLKVAFRGGNTILYRRIASTAKLWTEYANIKFDFGDDPTEPNSGKYYLWNDEKTSKYDIRIGFDQPGYWSFLGRQSTTLDAKTRTMNLGGFHKYFPPEGEAIILHEFGYALGLTNHELHPNINSSLRFENNHSYVPTFDSFGQPTPDSAGRHPRISTYFGGSSNHLSRLKIDRMLHTSDSLYLSPKLEPDSKSIMLNALTPHYFQEGIANPRIRTKQNKVITEFDKKWIQYLYPRDESKRLVLTTLLPKPIDSVDAQMSDDLDIPMGWIPLNGELEAKIDDSEYADFQIEIKRVASGRSVGIVLAQKPFNHPFLTDSNGQPAYFKQNAPIGTVFLVSHSLMLTNAHVIPDRETLRNTKVMFGYTSADSKDKRTFYFERIVTSSPPDKFDFTLIRIRPHHDQPRLPGDRFSNVKLPSRPIRLMALNERKRVVVIQHPDGHPLRRAENGGIKGLSPDKKMFFHTTNTDFGSSGSPVFDRYYNLLGIHIGGNRSDYDSEHRRYLSNKAVKIDVVVDEILRGAEIDENLLQELGFTN